MRTRWLRLRAPAHHDDVIQQLEKAAIGNKPMSGKARSGLIRVQSDSDFSALQDSRQLPLTQVLISER